MQEFKIDPIIYKTKPSKIKRSQQEMDIYDLLEQLNIAYLRLDHDETPSIEFCHEVEKLLDIEICKNLFLCNSPKTHFYLLVMPGRKKFKTKDLSAQINSSRLSFAAAEDMETYLHTKPGSASVLGLVNDKSKTVQLLIDKDVLQSEYFGCHPCVNTSSLKIRTSDLLTKFLPYTGHEPIWVELPAFQDHTQRP
ncbi:prolyl-tRNA synthetase associated domain-containing protein [Desulfosporosinus sp. PR]|uniref:prolyl-tRNA synthetase associated domain-containing protein n=1 Tax=Candidatus Desulfosporosinus nitrosoreducens TaxID=3401928 RepID=UPI0027EFC6BD|nr:prolyl-tRNA synthetase associated domain-containing protein [Desulfosporosinus sp. PR]MDQ7092316.1 prolyl-tRNA synthetase associated domain-containing protein [Desulfosporosinus sp. PR]